MSALSQQVTTRHNEHARKHEKHKTQKTQMIHKRSIPLERLLNTHVNVSNGGNQGLKVVLIYTHTLCRYASNKGSDESVHLHMLV